MFLVCEAIAWGMEHVPFNTSLLRTIRYAFPDDTIRFCGEESHIGYIREQIGANFDRSIVWESITLPPRHSGFYNRFFSDFKRTNFLLNRLNDSSAEHILVTTGNPSILWAVKLLVSTTHKDKTVQVVIHGDFYPLSFGRFVKRNFNPLYRIRSMKTALQLTGYRRIQHIVLEDAVRDSVIKKIPLLENHISVLDHPLPSDEYVREDTRLSIPVHFGFLGLATEHKGFSQYLTVAAAISKKFPGRAKFHAIGRITDRYKQANLPELSFLSDFPDTKRLTRSEYIRQINKLHFVCMFFDDAYEYTASGVLLDSIAFGKPIVATQLTTFKNLANRYGDIGYLCKPNEIIETISAIVQQNDSRRYEHQVRTMLRIKGSRSPETLAIKYRKLVGQLLCK
jgi:glycosyltransferase involved in cell wall biosynthesis